MKIVALSRIKGRNSVRENRPVRSRTAVFGVGVAEDIGFIFVELRRATIVRRS
jgi:hypothetical protein